MSTYKNAIGMALILVIGSLFTMRAVATNLPVKINNASVVKYELAIADTARIYNKADKMPAPAGGSTAFYNYLSKNITYPAVDRNNNVSGKVFVSVVVERDGSFSNVTAIKGPSETLKKEAVKAIKKSPKWRPGTIKGKSVRVKYVIPINFTLADA